MKHKPLAYPPAYILKLNQLKVGDEFRIPGTATWKKVVKIDGNLLYYDMHRNHEGRLYWDFLNKPITRTAVIVEIR